MISEFLMDKLTGGLSGLFSNNAEGVQPSGDSGFDIGGLVQNNELLVSLGVALMAGMADGEDGIVGTGIKGAFDFAAMNDIADGDSSIVSEIYMAYRAGSIVSERTGSTLAGLAAGAAAFWGLNKWEDNRQEHAQHEAAAPARLPAPAFAS